MNNWIVENEELRPVMGNKALEGQSRKPRRIVESPDKKFCIYIYGVDEPRMGYVLGNFMILEKVNGRTRIVLKNEGKRFEMWADMGDNASWSKNSRYAIVDIFPAIMKYHAAYRDAKLVVDVREGRFTIIPIAGSSVQQGLTIGGNGRVKVYVRGEEKANKHFIRVGKAVTSVKNLKWQGLERIGKAIDMLEDGYFGDIVGYKNEVLNIRFKNGYIPWPYKGIVKRRPKPVK